jgi:hypothetical protein
MPTTGSCIGHDSGGRIEPANRLNRHSGFPPSDPKSLLADLKPADLRAGPRFGAGGPQVQDPEPPARSSQLSFALASANSGRSGFVSQQAGEHHNLGGQQLENQEQIWHRPESTSSNEEGLSERLPPKDQTRIKGLVVATMHMNKCMLPCVRRHAIQHIYKISRRCSRDNMRFHMHRGHDESPCCWPSGVDPRAMTSSTIKCERTSWRTC